MNSEIIFLYTEIKFPNQYHVFFSLMTLKNFVHFKLSQDILKAFALLKVSIHFYAIWFVNHFNNFFD